MIKIYVVLIGLIALVPPSNPSTDPLVALLVRQDQESIGSSGKHIPAHSAIAYFRPLGYPDDEQVQLFLNGDTITFGTTPPVGFDKDKFISLSDIVGSSVRLSPGCNSANHTNLCRFNGGPALIGRIVFKDGLITPLRIINARVAEGTFEVDEKPFDIFEFRTFEGLKSSLVKASPTGLVYAVKMNPDQALISINGTDIRLDLSPIDLCRKLGPEDECTIVTIFNSSSGTVTSSTGSIRPDGKPDNPDFHFDAFYRLVVDGNILPRFLPLRKMRPSKGESDPPEARCIPPLIQE